MSGNIHLVATLVAKPGQDAALQAALTGILADVRSKAGCLRYDLHTTQTSIDCVTASRTCSPASRTGGGSPRATTAAQSCSFRPALSPQPSSIGCKF